MDTAGALYVARQAVYTGLLMVAPVLVMSLAIGLVTAIFQAVTSVREMTLAIVPKILVVAFTLVVCLGWMMQLIIQFTAGLFQRIGSMGG